MVPQPANVGSEEVVQAKDHASTEAEEKAPIRHSEAAEDEKNLKSRSGLVQEAASGTLMPSASEAVYSRGKLRATTYEAQERQIQSYSKASETPLAAKRANAASPSPQSVLINEKSPAALVNMQHTARAEEARHEHREDI
jgi:hypothetical protein